MEAPNEPIDDELLTYLEGVNERMHALCDAGFAFDPDHAEAQLGLDAAFLQQSVEAVLADAEKRSQTSLGLNDIVDAASRELLLSSAFPMVVRTSMHPNLPALHHPTELLSALLLRALQIAAENSGSDHEIAISTSHSENRVTVTIETTNQVDPRTMPIDLRSVSLTEMVQRIDGDLRIDRQEDLVRLTLEFATETSSI